MTNRQSRALLVAALVLCVGLAALRWRQVARDAALDDVERAANSAQPASPTLDTSLTAPETERARAAEAVPSEEHDPTPAAESSVPPELAGKGLWLRLVDDEGEPKPRIALEVAQELWITLGAEDPDKYVVERLVTDARGRVRIAARQPAEIENVAFTTTAGETRTAGAPFEFAAGTTDEVLLFYPEPVTIRGRVLDLAGNPLTTSARVHLEGCSVAPTPAGVHSFVAGEQTTYVDAAGRFAFETIAGWHALSAAEPGAPAAETVHVGVLAPTRSADVDLFVPKGERIVRVRLSSSARFEPSDVWIGAVGQLTWPAEPKTEGVSIERTRGTLSISAPYAGDAWELELPRGGTWDVRAGGLDFETAMQRLPDAAEEIVLTLVPRQPGHIVTLSGRVLDTSGKPLQAGITLLRAVDMGHFNEGRATRDGFMFRLGNVADDEALAYVVASYAGFGTSGVGPIWLTKSHEGLEIVLRPGLAIAGRVNGLPLGVEADVVLYARPARFERAEVPPASEWLSNALAGERTNTIDNGSFRLRNLPAGEYELWVEPQDGITPPARKRVVAGDERVSIELGSGLEGGLALLVRVVDDTTGAPVKGAEVELRSDRAGVRARGSRGTSDETGTCRLLGHAAGSWFVFVKAQGFAFPSEHVTEYTAGEHFVEVRLLPACVLDLLLTNPAGTPRAGVSVCATTRAGDLVDLLDRYGNWDGCFTQSDSSGRVVLNGVPAGRVRVVVGWKEGTRVEITDGQAPALANPLGLLVFELDAERGKRTIVKQVLH